MAALLLFVATGSVVRGEGDPHLDPSRLPEGCSTCHVGHGESDSPMMATSQKDLCLDCHGDVSRASPGVLERRRMKSIPRAVFGHPIDDHVFSRREGRVTCSSCHSPHRGMGSRRGNRGAGEKRVSPRDPTVMEHELCESCHGAKSGAMVIEPGSVADRISERNASYHPVQAPAVNRSPSVVSELSGKAINCTDCHGSDLPGARGPHSSTVPHTLVRSYSAVDGETESSATYALCYGCHEREVILGGDSFPEHRRHVVEVRASCSTCHDPHGSPHGRALVRLGQETQSGRLLPSARTGRLSFESIGPGSGACNVSCHGHDHSPEAYGFLEQEGGVEGGLVHPLAPTDPTRLRPTRVFTPLGRPGDRVPGRIRGLEP